MEPELVVASGDLAHRGRRKQLERAAELLRSLGHEVREASLVRTDLYFADEAFLCGTAAEVTPIASVDGQEIGGRGPVTGQVQKVFSNDYFRVYTSNDVAGVELGGSLKNVCAIAAGIADGMGFGHNTRAAIITRGLAELVRLAVKKGANPITLSGLAGMGDLVLTCTGDLSRNRNVGLGLGRGQTLQEVLAGMTQVAEGVRTAKSANDLASKLQVEIPLHHAVYRILHEGLPVRQAEL